MKQGESASGTFFVISKPQLYGDVLGYHLPWAFFSGGLLIVSTWCPSSWIPTIPCWFLNITGYPCPFCGMTRACLCMGDGHFAQAFIQSPLGSLFFVACVVTFLGNTIALVVGKKIAPGPWFHQTIGLRTKEILAGIAILVALNWMYRIVAGLK